MNLTGDWITLDAWRVTLSKAQIANVISECQIQSAINLLGEDLAEKFNAAQFDADVAESDE